MSVNPDDFESQLMAPLHLMDDTQSLYSDQDDQNDRVEHPAGDDTIDECESPQQESIQSRVEETQLLPLEVETQSGTQQTFPPSHRVDSQAFNQERSQSFVGETQLVTLEIDTQVDTKLANPTANPITNEADDQAFNNFVHCDDAPEIPANIVDAARSELPITEKGISTKLFERPIAPSAQDLGAGFKFSAPAKGPVLRARLKTTEQASGINLPSTIASKIERERVSVPVGKSSNRQHASNNIPSNSQPIPRNTVGQHAQASSTTPTKVSGHRAAMLNEPTTLIDSGSSSLHSMIREVVKPHFQASSSTTSSTFGATGNTPSALPDVTASNHRSVEWETMTQRPRHFSHNSTNIPSHEAVTQNIPSAFLQIVSEDAQTVIPPLLKFTEDVPTNSNLNKVQAGPQESMLPALPQRDDVLHVPPNPFSHDAQPNPRLKSVQSISHENSPQRVPQRAPLTSLRGAQNSRSVQRSSSKGRRLSFCPFPEAATSQSNRRWQYEKVPDIQQRTKISAEEYMNLEQEISRSETASNVGRARSIGNDLDQANEIEVDRPNSPSVVIMPRSHDLPQAEGQNEYAAREAEQMNNLKLPTYMSHSQGKEKSSEKNLQEMPIAQNEPLHNSDWSYASASPPTHERYNFSDCPEHAVAEASNENPNNTSYGEEEYLPVPDTENVNQAAPLGLLLDNQNENGIVESQDILQGLPRVPSRAQSMARPESRRSNQGKAMTRPLLSTLQPQGTFEVNRTHDVPSKVAKPTNRQDILAGAAQTRPPSPKSKVTLSKYMEFLQRGADFAEVVRSCEEQQALIESQRVDILKLQQASESSQKQMQALEAEKTALVQNLQKFTDMSSKYKKHMNEVVKSQKFLKAEALELMKTSSNALKAQAKKEATMQQIKAAVKEAREMGLSVENLSEKLSAASIEKKELENDKTDLLKQLNAEKKTNALLEDDLQHRLIDLSRETHRKEQLEKLLETQISIYKELIEQMSQLPGAVAEQLQIYNGFLANILNAENATHAKIDEVTLLVNNVKSNEPEPPASLIKLIEDLSSRLENREQSAETGLSFQKTNSRTLEELKGALGQLCLDKDTETRYNDRITSLEQARADLTADKSAFESEIQNMTQQVENLKRDLTGCRSQLAIRDEELAAARIVLTVDSGLRANIQELESFKAVLESRLAIANQELSRAQDDAKSIQEITRLKERQTKDLEQKLHNAQMKIRNFDEERDKYIAAKELETKAACQDLTRKAETQKATMQLKLGSEVRNIEQRYKEKETELGLVKEKLQKLQAERDTSASDLSKLRHQQSQYLVKAEQHVAQIKQLEEGALGRKTSDELLKGLQSVKNESAEIQTLFRAALGKPQQLIDAAIQKQQEIATNLRNVADLEAENHNLLEQNIALQDRVESLSEALARQTQTEFGPGKQRLSANTTAVQILSFENTPQITVRASRPSSRSNNVRSEPGTHEVPDTGGMDDPVETLRKAMKRAEPKSTIQTGQSQNFMVRNNSMSATPMNDGRSTSTVDEGPVASSSSWQRRSASQSSAQSIRPFSEVALSVQSSSSLSELDTDKLFDEIDLEWGEHDQASKTSDNYERSDAAIAGRAFGSIPKQISPSESSSRVSRDQPLNKKVKSTRNVNAPQLTSKTLKSAMKQSTKPAFGVDPTPNHITFAEPATSGIPGESRMDFMSNAPRQEFRPEHLPGTRSGNGVGSNMAASAHWPQTYDQRPSLVSSDQVSPVPTHGLRRYNLKRTNSGSESSKSPKKRYTASRKPSRSVIPDSQEAK